MQFCTRNDSVIIVTCAKCISVGLMYYKPQYYKISLDFEFDRIIASGMGARGWPSFSSTNVQPNAKPELHMQ